ncbi:unnamed protein product, partial [Rotaria sp. Silwood2]
RFSNGKIWIEKLGISKLINYAYESATTDNNLITDVTAFQLIVSGIRQQITTYKNTTDLSVKYFLIVNQPPFQAYPSALSLNMNDYLNKLTLEHNNNLSNSIQTLQSNYSNISFKLFDVYSLIENILINGSTYKINSRTNCWNTSSNNTVVQLSLTPDTYLYIDEYQFYYACTSIDC